MRVVVVGGGIVGSCAATGGPPSRRRRAMGAPQLLPAAAGRVTPSRQVWAAGQA